MANVFDTKIEFLKGVGPKRAELLQKELGIFTFGDLIQYLPFRYEDRSKIQNIRDLHEDLQFVQIKARVRSMNSIGIGKAKRIVVVVEDHTGSVELVWFQGHHYLSKIIKPNVEYLIYGRPNLYGRNFSIVHPEIEPWDGSKPPLGFFQPVYSVTDKLRTHSVDSRAIYNLQKHLIENSKKEINENLPDFLIEKYRLISKADALHWIHIPENQFQLKEATRRLKFEELFYVQLKLVRENKLHKEKVRGLVFSRLNFLQKFYKEYLPFELTNAQKRVIKEIREDVTLGYQMNRLLQGDVGSGKTMVAFICMLMAIDNNTQACLMAPTEILAEQHFNGLKGYCDLLGIEVALLTGSSKTKERKVMHNGLESGSLNIVIGTHALLEDKVRFKMLGLCIIDEQHRFGVAQRAKLWEKNDEINPHILVMTATPIPRTLAMTVYGELDLSVIDELPPGRKPITTIMKTDAFRLALFGFLKEQIDAGRQIYIVYPLIEESEKSDLKDLMDGYESVSRYFPDLPLSILHGKMKSEAKEFEMKRFKDGETKIMVATTVIEVGVNVPNATVMVIENAERFGLSQLHQLRGRVGRGAEKSFCILMHKDRISKESKIRLQTMCETNDGFKIADVDLQLRGPGDLSGLKQSGLVDLMIANLSQDHEIVKEARKSAFDIITSDPEISSKQNQNIRKHLSSIKSTTTNWSKIS